MAKIVVDPTEPPVDLDDSGVVPELRHQPGFIDQIASDIGMIVGRTLDTRRHTPQVEVTIQISYRYLIRQCAKCDRYFKPEELKPVDNGVYVEMYCKPCLKEWGPTMKWLYRNVTRKIPSFIFKLKPLIFTTKPYLKYEPEP